MRNNTTMQKDSYKSSELVLSPDGRLYHIHAVGEELADDIFLVGDPGRVDMFRDFFETVDYESSNREMRLLTGLCRGHRVSVLSTGMGCDNIDIVMTELDAAANLVAHRGEVDASHPHRSLNIVRIGTCGSLCAQVGTGSVVASAYAVGLDGLMNYYACDNSLFEEDMLAAFEAHMGLSAGQARPYCVRGSEALLRRMAEDMHKGITVTAPGFYGPQGRNIRLRPAVADLNERLMAFGWNGLSVTNLEMETSAIYGFARQLGHQTLTVCLVIANRVDGTFLNDYHDQMHALIDKLMSRLVAS